MTLRPPRGAHHEHPLKTFANKPERLAFVKVKIATAPAWALRALEIVAARQTTEEFGAEVTAEDNGVGFTGLDAGILTSFAKQYEAWKIKPASNRYPTPLSEKQMNLLMKKMGKYAKQVIAAELAKFDEIYPVVHQKNKGVA